MTLEETIKIIEEKHPRWSWLVRKDPTEGYFANIYNYDSTIKFPYFASEPALALQKSWDDLEEFLLLHPHMYKGTSRGS